MNITKKQLTKKVRENCMVTPAGWGNTCIIFDEVLACESMVECDWDTYESGADNGKILIRSMMMMKTNNRKEEKYDHPIPQKRKKTSVLERAVLGTPPTAPISTR